MVNDIKRVKEVVREILVAIPGARDDDDLLYLLVCQEMCEKPLCEISLVDAFMHRKELNLPPFESVRRTRQRWQESCPVLRGNNRKLKEIEAELMREAINHLV